MKDVSKMSERELRAEVIKLRCALDALRKDKDAPLYIRSYAGSYLGLHFEDDARTTESRKASHIA